MLMTQGTPPAWDLAGFTKAFDLVAAASLNPPAPGPRAAPTRRCGGPSPCALGRTAGSLPLRVARVRPRPCLPS